MHGGKQLDSDVGPGAVDADGKTVTETRRDALGPIAGRGRGTGPLAARAVAANEGGSMVTFPHFLV
jgi:hypothetical protein